MKLKTIIFIGLIFLIITAACQKSVITHPGANDVNKQRRAALIQEADREFQKMYWAGWHNAIPLTESALAIENDKSLKEKLFFSCLLLAMREKEFDVRNLKSLEKAEKLLADGLSETLGIYLSIARRIVIAPGLSENFQIQKIKPEPPEKVKANIAFLKDRSGSDYLTYFYLQYIATLAGGRELDRFNQERDRFLKEFPDSNLRIDMGGVIHDLEQTLTDYPDFIELILFQADQLVKAGKNREAESRYRDVLDINPNVPSAHTGIGSLYFWLELFEEAESNYDRALAIIPYYSKALFGKAMCRHYRDDFMTSNEILLRLIENQPLYHGEAYYYQALNHFNLKNNQAVIENIEKAMTFIPHSTDLNAFAGIFYYSQKDLKQAKYHLETVFRHRVHHPDAYFYAGLIAMTEKEPPDHYFISSAEFYREELENQRRQMDKVNQLDLNEKLKIKLRLNRRQRMEEFIRESIFKLKKMLTVFRKNTKAFSQIKANYEKIVTLNRQLTQKAPAETGE